jgi:hypothetical protein
MSERMGIGQLERMPPAFRVVFAAASAERLVPAYLSFSRRTGRGDPVVLTAMLERLWLDAQGNRMDAQQVQESIDLRQGEKNESGAGQESRDELVRGDGELEFTLCACSCNS